MTDRHSDAPPHPLLCGPILHARGADAQTCRLAAVVVLAPGGTPPALTTEGGSEVSPEPIARFADWEVWRYDFTLPARSDAGYRLGAQFYPVDADLAGDLDLAFVSCNGQEHGDAERPIEERDAMWQRLREEHARRPFRLLLHGGDQLYADEVVESHPEVSRWEKAGPRKRHAIAFTDAMREAARRHFFARYVGIMAQPSIAWMLARVPSLMMWDDHDILDGWGSHPPSISDSPVGRGLFEAAREAFALFQLGAAAADLPAICLDREGRNLGWVARFPDFAVHAPDLRSERRQTRVMGEAGWRVHEAALAGAARGERQLLMSSVPALGPRLSWVEMAMDWFPHAQKYEDDLRDQWQSRAHRDEWKRFLAGLDRTASEGGAPVTLLSGEIHLATRGEMRLGDGSAMHQLVASGIAHPKPPAAYAFALGLLARFGDSPLPDRPIRLHPLPGQSGIYAAERNYLVLRRRAGAWTAEWELEESGRTPPLSL